MARVEQAGEVEPGGDGEQGNQWTSKRIDTTEESRPTTYQIAAVGTLNAGPGISYTDLYSLYAADEMNTEAREPIICP